MPLGHRSLVILLSARCIAVLSRMPEPTSISNARVIKNLAGKRSAPETRASQWFGRSALQQN